MIRIAMIEDEKEAKDVLESYCERYAKEKGVNFQIAWFPRPLDYLADGSKFDLVFLDIELPDMSGMELAKRIRKTDADVVLVFVTNYSMFAVKGYEVDASDFIVKPVTYYDFCMKFGHALKHLAGGDEDGVRIAVKNNGAVKYISVENLFYAEVLRHKLVYHTAEGDFEVRRTLKKAEEELAGNGFSRVNKYCIVNFRYVIGVKGYVLTLSTGLGTSSRTEIMISHPRKKDFVKELNEWLGERI